jgi:cytochrome c oxidase cbb3-type subunit 4
MERWAYEDVLVFAQSWGAVYFIAMFAAAFAYAMWPSNRAGFRRAAYIPLHDDGADGDA